MNTSIRKTIVFTSSVVGLSLLAFLPAAAQVKTVQGDQLGIASGTGVKGAVGYILVYINLFLVFVGIAAAVFLIIGGLQYIMSRGDESAAQKAKGTILYAVIGLLVVGLSAAIVNFVVGAIRLG